MKEEKGEIIHAGSPGRKVEFYIFFVFTCVNVVLVVVNKQAIIAIIIAIIACAIWGASGLLLMLRHLKTYYQKDFIQPFAVQEVTYKKEKEKNRVFARTPRPPLTPVRQAKYLEICQKYIEYKRDHPNVSNETIFQEILYIGSTELYDALQAWRLGEFDDRPWYKKIGDKLNGRNDSDLTRYLPPR